ncbi:MAG: cytidylate kinase-like family protein, partial [Clostridia bacterium]
PKTVAKTLKAKGKSKKPPTLQQFFKIKNSLLTDGQIKYIIRVRDICARMNTNLNIRFAMALRKKGAIMRTIITIGRQFGSGGRLIAKRLAAALGIPFYDKELIALAAKESGLDADVISRVDEKPTSIFNYNFFANVTNTYVSSMDVSLNDKLFVAMSRTIKNLASDGACVVLGRCGNYVLRDNPNVISLFIYADMDKRIAKVCASENVNEPQAKDMIKKMDKKRSSYYTYYTDSKWGSPETYDYMLNSSRLGFDKTVELIRDIVTLNEQV